VLNQFNEESCPIPQENFLKLVIPGGSEFYPVGDFRADRFAIFRIPNDNDRFFPDCHEQAGPQRTKARIIFPLCASLLSSSFF